MMSDKLNVEDLAEDLVDFEVLERSYPLSLWRAWHRPQPRTSQRAALQALQVFHTLLVLGGNRSGKTELMRAVLVALALGSDHPVARVFWMNNQCDPDRFPKGPGRCWVVARSSNDSIRYHRKQIGRLVGSSEAVRWWNKNRPGEARVEIDVPGYEHPAEIWFKSEDQGEDAMQGDSCRAILHDEEGDSCKVWDEAQVRLWDQRGWHLMSNTPVKGLTWVYDRFVANTPADVSVKWIHSTDNPFLPQEEVRKLAKGNPQLAAARLRGEFVALEGRVYPQFSRGVHVVEPFEIPADWLRFRAVDFGTRHPFVCLWGALGPDDQLYIYREHYQAERTLAHHAGIIRYAEGWVPQGDGWAVPDDGQIEDIELAWADPEDPQQLMQLQLDHDLDFVPAIKAVAHGIDVVSERLDPEQLGGPALFFFANCVNTIREHEGYLWADGSKKADQPDRPRKKNDHTCDAVRYMCVGVRLSV